MYTSKNDSDICSCRLGDNGLLKQATLRHSYPPWKASLILFAYNLMIGYSKKNQEHNPREYFWQKKKKPEIKFSPGLALTGVRTTGPMRKDLQLVIYFLRKWQCLFSLALNKLTPPHFESGLTFEMTSSKLWRKTSQTGILSTTRPKWQGTKTATHIPCANSNIYTR